MINPTHRKQRFACSQINHEHFKDQKISDPPYRCLRKKRLSAREARSEGVHITCETTASLCKTGQSKPHRQILFEGVSLTTVILTSGASSGSCLLRAMSRFRGIRGIRGLRLFWLDFETPVEVERFEVSKEAPLSKVSVSTFKNTRFLITF